MGNADIIMEDSVLVTVIAEDDDTQLETSSPSSVSSVELKGTETFGKDVYSQIRAQSIVFSFYQQKHNLEKMRTCLVPVIGISNEKLYYSFYDSEHDVMLVSGLLSMWQVERIVTYNMVFLWMVLNYRLFCSGVTDEMKSYPSGFFRLVGPFLKVYKSEVTMPAHRQHTENSTPQDWTIYEGAPMPTCTPSVDLVEFENKD